MEKILLNNETQALIQSAKDVINNVPLLDIEEQSTALALKSLSEEMKNTAKLLNEKRLETTKPLRDNIDEINGEINPVISMLEDISKEINNAVFAWQKKEKERIEALNRAALLEQAANITSDELVKSITPIVTAPKLTKTKKEWQIKLTGSIKDVDPAFVILSLDMVKINNEIKAGKIKSKNQIKGLSISREEIPVRG